MFYFRLPNGAVKPVGYDLTGALSAAAPTCLICNEVVIINSAAQIVTTLKRGANGLPHINRRQFEAYTDVHLLKWEESGAVFQLSALN